MGTLFFLALVHDRERPTAQVFALRRTSALLYVIAALLGAALLGPLGLMSDAIYARYPLPQEELELLTTLFRAQTRYQWVGIVVAAGVLGPVVEEMFFRGGLLGNLWKRWRTPLTVVGSSLLFAAAHRDPRNFAPDFLGGVIMGFVRVWSGSLVPSILLHVVFNTVSVVVLLHSGPEAEVFSKGQSWGALVVSALLLWLFWFVARNGDSAAGARQADTEGGAML